MSEATRTLVRQYLADRRGMDEKTRESLFLELACQFGTADATAADVRDQRPRAPIVFRTSGLSQDDEKRILAAAKTQEILKDPKNW